MEFNALGKKRTTLGWIWLALAMIWTAPPESQAQYLFLHVYPSQDDPTKTLWIFGSESGTTTPFYGNTIRSGGNDFHRRDSWKLYDINIYGNNKPTNQLFSLSPLFSSTNHPKDIDSITRRIPGAPSFGPLSENTILFANANITNSPTMTAGSATETIGSIFMNNVDQDYQAEIGIRGMAGDGVNLGYTTNDVFRWVGTGILDKPISDFRLRDSFIISNQTSPTRPFFASRDGGISLTFHSRAIPEPAEYALVFGLFALAFVIFSRQFKRNRQL